MHIHNFKPMLTEILHVPVHYLLPGDLLLGRHYNNRRLLKYLCTGKRKEYWIAQHNRDGDCGIYSLSLDATYPVLRPDHYIPSPIALAKAQALMDANPQVYTFARLDDAACSKVVLS